MGKCFIVNAPLAFRGIWAVVTPWLPPRTLLKIEVLGKEYKERLKVLVDADKIPTMLGASGLNYTYIFAVMHTYIELTLT